jgi:hypothetical protein
MKRSMSVEVALDSRQRLPLAKIIEGDQTRFRVTHLGGGALHLEPVLSFTSEELSLLADPARIASIQDGVMQATLGNVVKGTPDEFVKLAAELGIDIYEED